MATDVSPNAPAAATVAGLEAVEKFLQFPHQDGIVTLMRCAAKHLGLGAEKLRRARCAADGRGGLEPPAMERLAAQVEYHLMQTAKKLRRAGGLLCRSRALAAAAIDAWSSMNADGRYGGAIAIARRMETRYGGAIARIRRFAAYSHEAKRRLGDRPRRGGGGGRQNAVNEMENLVRVLERLPIHNNLPQ